MIYHFKTSSVKKKDIIEKDMYLTADNERSFYRRVREQYALTPDEVTILEEIEDETIDISTDRFKKPKNKIVEEPDVNLIKAKEMLDGDIRGLNDKKLHERILSGWKYHDILDEYELADRLKEYKTVKLYYLKTGAKKNKKYIVLCK